MTKEEQPLFVSDDWQNDSLRGLTQRYMILSKVNWDDSYTTSKIDYLISSLCLKSQRYPRLNRKCNELLRSFREHHDFDRITETDA